jgi:hypothetical protein
MVASCDANHFRKSDIPILTAFATATHLSQPVITGLRGLHMRRQSIDAQGAS